MLWTSALALVPALGGCARPAAGIAVASGQQATTTAGSKAPAAMGGACGDAALTMSADTAIATLNGEPILANELGDGIVRREQQLLRTYCDEVAKLRTMALENLLADRVLQAKAKAGGTTVEALVRSTVEAATQQQPSDAEIQAFYDERSPPNAPPLELVRDQVVAALQQGAAEQAVEKLVTDTKAAAAITRSLPDVRPPALEVNIPTHTAAAGPSQAVVSVVEFADFECPYCSKAADAMRQVKKVFAGKPVRFAYRHFPLSFHPSAQLAAEYSQCANAQGKFWEFHDVAYDNQRALGEESLRGYAQQAGVEMAALDDCLKSGQGMREVEADKVDAERFGVEGTPTFFINGRPVMTGGDVGSLTGAIEEELSKQL